MVSPNKSSNGFSLPKLKRSTPKDNIILSQRVKSVTKKQRGQNFHHLSRKREHSKVHSKNSLPSVELLYIFGTISKILDQQRKGSNLICKNFTSNHFYSQSLHSIKLLICRESTFRKHQLISFLKAYHFPLFLFRVTPIK